MTNWRPQLSSFLFSKPLIYIVPSSRKVRVPNVAEKSTTHHRQVTRRNLSVHKTAINGQ